MADMVCSMRGVIDQAVIRALLRLAVCQGKAGGHWRKGGIMLQWVQPVFGDVVLDGMGACGVLFMLFLIWEAWKEWRIRARRARKAQDRARVR
jgi:hypothetical protein